MKGLLQQFDESAIQSLILAQNEAQVDSVAVVDTDHVLRAILRQKSLGAKLLNDLGTTYEIALSGSKITPSYPRLPKSCLSLLAIFKDYSISSDCVDLLKLARSESENLGHSFVNTEHLLLGLAKQRDTNAMTILRSINIDVPKFARALRQAIASNDAKLIDLTGQHCLSQLSPQCQRVMNFAREEAIRIGQTSIGTEQVLLALIRENELSAGQRLIPVSLDHARSVINQLCGSGNVGAPGGPISPMVKEIVKAASGLANDLSHSTVQPAHMLLAIAGQRRGVAIKVLQALNVDVHQLQRDLRRTLSSSSD